MSVPSADQRRRLTCMSVSIAETEIGTLEPTFQTSLERRYDLMSPLEAAQHKGTGSRALLVDRGV